MNVYILKTHDTRDVPGAVDWTSICHLKDHPCWLISYSNSRSTGRWTSETRKRPWRVFRCSKRPSFNNEWSTHKTLELALAAIAAANKHATFTKYAWPVL
jgi:hypothetical protein